MSDILGIALSGASAATKRIDASASNLANQRTTGRLPDAGSAATDRKPRALYAAHHQPERPAHRQRPRRRHSSLAEAAVAALRRGVRPVVIRRQRGRHGRAPNVDTGQEIGQQILGSRAYSASMSMARTSSDMMKDLLNMTA